ncbi:MAG: hydroxyacylglutathione hydrolase [Pseudohongiellaceae bacterium]
MNFSIHPIPAFADNYIWAFADDAGQSACVVDPGDARPVLDYLERESLRLDTILITHHHADHTGGLEILSRKYQPTVYGPATGNTPGITRPVTEGADFELFGVRFAVLEVPGHTLDHIAYYCRPESSDSPPLLFCGDTLFAAGCGRLFEGTAPMMYHSLQKIRNLEGNTKIYCTHEYTLSNLRFAAAADPENPELKDRISAESAKRGRQHPTLPSTLSLELLTNPFLRCDNTALRATATQHAAGPVRTEVDVFAALRHWKDNF